MSPSELQRAAELLDVIVRPGDHPFHDEITEAKALLGYVDPPGLGRGASVRVTIPNRFENRLGKIVGEARNGEWWYVSFGTARRWPINKKLCRPVT